MNLFRAPKHDTRLRLTEVMALRRAWLPDPLPPEAARYAQEAAERCLACRRKRLCDEALAAGKPEPFSLFCPNTHYIEQVRSGSLRFR